MRCSAPAPRPPSTVIVSASLTSRAGSVTVSPLIVTRPAPMISSARRREATPAWARYFWRRTTGDPTLWVHGSRASRRDALRQRGAALPRPPGVGLGRARREGLRRDDRSARRAAQAPGARGAVLVADRRRGGGRVGRDGQD